MNVAFNTTLRGVKIHVKADVSSDDVIRVPVMSDYQIFDAKTDQLLNWNLTEGEIFDIEELACQQWEMQ